MTLASVALTDRIAHVLGVSSEEIDFLGRLDSDTLRALHSQIVELLFDPAQSRMGGLQNAAKILPPPVTAKVAEKALGPVLAGRIAGLLDTGSSVAIARRLPPEFLADVAGHVHPQRVEVLVRDLPSRQLDAAADVLIERHDLLALGHFAGIIRPDTLQSIVSRLDASVILDVVPYIEPAARVDDLIELVENPVLLSVLRTAHDNTRWVDAFDLVDLLNLISRTRVAELSVPESELIDGAVRAAAEWDRWPALLSFASLASGVPAKHWKDIDSFGDPEIIGAAIEGAARHDLWDPLALLVTLWPAVMRRKIGPTIDSEYRARLAL